MVPEAAAHVLVFVCFLLLACEAGSWHAILVSSVPAGSWYAILLPFAPCYVCAAAWYVDLTG